MKFQRKKAAVAIVYALGACGMAILVAGSALAQDIKVEVTGSNIKRIEGEGSLPVQILSRDDIDKTGATNVMDLLTFVSANNSGGAIAGSNSVGALTFSAQTASLRGLGGGRTLVLVNGQRLSEFGGTIQGVQGVNLDMIPLSAVERVEILKDGASAIYGSDAIGGVINFIMRQDYSGAEVTAYGAWPTRSGGGDAWQGKAAAGYGDLAKDRFNVFVSGSYIKQNQLLDKDRDFAKTSFLPDQGLNTLSGNTFPGFISTGNIGSPNYPACDNVYSSVNTGGRCRFDPSLVAQALPESENTTSYGSVRFQINNDWQAYVTGMYAKAVNKVHLQPVPLSDQFALPPTNPLFDAYGGTDRILLPPTSPFYPHALAQAAGVDGQLLNVRYRAFENGDRQFTDTNEGYGVNVGLSGTWKTFDILANGYWNRNTSTEVTTDGYPILSQVLPLLNSGAINLFAPNTPDALARLRATNFNGEAFNGTTTQYGAEIKGSGEVWKVPAGALSVAFGAQAWKEEFVTDFNPLLQVGDVSGYGGNNLNVNASRNVYAVFGEATMPIVKSLEVDAAVRYDHYSDVGSTTNPKFSARWLPVKQLLLRASWGTGFLAPSLYQLFIPQTQGVTQAGLSDPVRCPVTNDSNDCNTQFPVTFGGNPNLKPEKSQQTNVGFVFEPMTGLSVGIDWFKLNLYQTITNGVPPDTILGDLDQFGSLVTRRPPVGGLPGQITNIDQFYINQGTTKIVGWDLTANWTLPPTPWGRFKLGLSGSYYSKYDVEQPDGSFAGFVSNAAGASTPGITPRWKSYQTIGWDYGPWSAVLGNLYSSGYLDQSGDRTVGTLSIWDLHTSYTGFKNTTLVLGVKNLFDTNPPFTNQSTTFQNGYDPNQYNPLARVVYASVTYKFDWPKGTAK